jgi:hypothetical protein
VADAVAEVVEAAVEEAAEAVAVVASCTPVLEAVELDMKDAVTPVAFLQDAGADAAAPATKFTAAH